jgi:hypothetical protein
VKHTYTDLFFLHKHNDPSKAIRAIVQVPVVVTAYLDLKEIKLVKENDSVRQIVLPRAQLNEPQYQVHNMLIRGTRSVQLHMGKDLYPQVGAYIQQLIAVRTDTVRNMAVTNRILAQAEEEGKEYVITLLRELGHREIRVTMAGQKTTQPVSHPAILTRLNRTSKVDFIPFGFIPF